MSTLPGSPRNPGGPNLNLNLNWLIPIGILLLAGGIAALIGTANANVVDWIKDNSSCNERQCTYDEAKTILLTFGIFGTVAGAAITGFALWRALRGRDAGPVMPPEAGLPPAAAEEPDSSRFGFPDKPAGDAPADRLAMLDEQLAEGSLGFEEYSKRRGDILEEI